MKKLLVLLFVGLLFSCNQSAEKKANTAEGQDATEIDDSKFGRKNFAVIWTWTTKHTPLLSDNIEVISAELMELWQKDIIENAYFNTDPGSEKLGDFPNISFFIKAKTTDDAEKELNNLTIVKKGIADYTLVPVGTLWLARKTEELKKKGIQNSYVAVWSTNNEGEPGAEDIKAQSDATMELWNEGTIENVYFDIEGTQENNDISDFVFFVHAESEDEAANICDNLPFAKNDLADYKLYPVGVFWLGKSEQ